MSTLLFAVAMPKVFPINRFGWAVALACAVLPCWADAPTAELVSNGNFEKRVANELAAGWQPVYGGYSISAQQAWEGHASLRVEGKDETGREGAVQVIQGFSPGGKILVRARIYVEEFRSGIIKPIHLGFTSEGRKYYPHINLVHGAEPENFRLGEWMEFEKEVDLASHPDVKEISVYCVTWNLGETPFRGRVFFNGISAKEIPKTVVTGASRGRSRSCRMEG